MKQAIENREIKKELFLEHRLKVEFDIRLLTDKRAIAKQARGLAVRYHSPETLRPVEVFLHQ